MNKEIKTQTLDLAKTINYLNDLSKSNNQSYVTKEGIALLEGVLLTGNEKVKVVDSKIIDELKQTIEHQKNIISAYKAKKKSIFNF